MGLWEPVPASADDTGYKGRIGLYEAIFMDDELANFLRDNPPENEIAKLKQFLNKKKLHKIY